MIHTAECVTAWHPDKICDQISDGILDECLRHDPYSRVAVETLGGHNTIVLVGEVTTKAQIDFSAIARAIYRELVGKEIGVLCNIVKQSPEISQGVNTGGAGDQGIMVGYACNETPEEMPFEFLLARDLLKPYTTDGKSQVTVEDDRVTDVVLSVQGENKEELNDYLSGMSKTASANKYCNNTGAFTVGGFDADSGVTGRKIVVDAYGPRVPVGGGAFSGKDATKVDRSAAYMARHIARIYLRARQASEVLAKIAYVIGKAEPVMAIVEIKGPAGITREVIDQQVFDCRPEAIIERFNLRRPIYQNLAKNGHFGRKGLPWES